MEFIEDGDKVQLVCELKLEDGTVCYKNEQEEPFVIVIGEGKFLPAIEKELKKMKEGETKTIILEPKDAFGMHNDDLVVEIPIKDLGSNDDLNVGSRIKTKTSSDQVIKGTVMEINDDNLTVDFNHPLVDKKIFLTVTITSIEKI